MNEDAHRIRSLRGLPRAIAPPRDLWPAIEAQIAGDARARGARGGARVPVLRVRLFASAAWRTAAGAAAAAVLLGIGIWIGRGPLGPAAGETRPAIAASGASGAPERAGDPAHASPVTFAAGAAYSEQRAALLRDVAAQIQALPPESRTKVEQSLTAVRRSIEELRAALGEDPSNVLLQELLVNAYQNEMRVLVAVQEAGRTGQET